MTDLSAAMESSAIDNTAWPKSIHRLHLGAMDAGMALDHLSACLFNENWLHLGDFSERLEQSPSIRRTPAGLFRLARPTAVNRPEEQATYFLPFWYQKGTRLPFRENGLTFIFSEHFFEHVFLDEACELFKECFRVLGTGGAMRVAVPDADLRTYEAPEPAGFSTGGQRWTDPGKHKSRWSVYSLTYVLQWIGFRTRGVVYCDRHGRHHVDVPTSQQPFYDDCSDRELIKSTRYIARLRNSLIVDAVKP